MIELMIVVAIIGILAAVTLPACQTYTVKDVYQTCSAVPTSGNWWCETPSATSGYVASVTTNVNGAILVKLSNDHAFSSAHIAGNVLTLISADSLLRA